MRSKDRNLALTLLCVVLACAGPQLLAKKNDKTADPGPKEQRRARQALNRLTFGSRPGDVQQVMAMGVDRWIDLQLHPEKISDTAIESRLAAFRTLHMSSKEIVEDFPDNQMIRQVMDGKRPMPTDPARHAVYQVQIARMQEKHEKKGRKEEAPSVPPQPLATETAKTAEELAAAASPSNVTPNLSSDSNSTNSMSAPNGDGHPSDSSAPPGEVKRVPAEDAEARRREDRLYADLKIEGLVDLPPEQRYKQVMAMSAEEQVAFADLLRRDRAEELLAGVDPKQKETLLAMNNPQAVVVDELIQAKLLRAIYSERQLEEVMTDFWFNHFNVFVGKGPERVLLTDYEQNVIRPHALGRFEDLLVATAKSQAMLFYLDNWMSVGPNSMQARGIPARPVRPYGRPRRSPPRNAKRGQDSGLNENYGRELLELHTLSVNGGYSQRDVTEAAKVFTGWTIEKPYEGLGFRYDERMHEPGPKFVLGHRIKPKGEGEGRELLHMLATSPQTAHFISLKLAQRFVSDDPPAGLIDSMAKTFEKKKGDIREVLTTLFRSPEFWAVDSYRSKVKTPFEFVVSAVRATGAEVNDAMPLAHQIATMGMPLYGAQPPTGYSMKADTWVSASSLLNRMNFALGLTGGKVRGVKMDALQLAGGPPMPADATVALSTMEAKLLATDVSKQTHDSIMSQLGGSAQNGLPEQQTNTGPQRRPAETAHPPDASTIAGLLLGSPEFQKR